MPSGLRGTVRWRGRVRAEFPTWSVLPAAVIVILVGGLFWASVWFVFSAPANNGAGASSEMSDEAALSADELVDTDQAVADAVERPDMLHGQATANPDTEVEAMTAGPVYGPADPASSVEESESPEAIASGDAAEQQRAETGEQAVDKAAELTTRAEEATARAEELTARAEELTVKIEGLTTKIEELEAKLTASGAALAALPALVPSPVPAPRSPESVALRAGQAASGTRAPWVVGPQPEPGSRVTVGPLVLEARARGEAPITQIRLVLDGVALPVALEQRDDTTWRGRATTRVGPGSHTVAIAVVDGQGRTGSYRWQFEARS